MCPQYGGSCSGPALNHAGHNNFIINRGLLDLLGLGWISNWWRRGKLHSGCKQLTSLMFDYREMCRAPKVGHNVY